MNGASFCLFVLNLGEKLLIIINNAFLVFDFNRIVLQYADFLLLLC